MIRSTQSLTSKVATNKSRQNELKSKPGSRFYGVRIFYAVFFGIAALGFAFQASQIDTVDIALISFCALASLVSFMTIVKPNDDGQY